MFSTERDASKVALHRLVEMSLARNVALIDCQVASAHLESLGARPIPRSEFVSRLAKCIANLKPVEGWPGAGVPNVGR